MSSKIVGKGDLRISYFSVGIFLIFALNDAGMSNSALSAAIFASSIIV
jgi:hypothetical protein